MVAAICTNCKVEKDQAQFHKDKKSPTGFCYRCKPCSLIVSSAWQKKNKERQRELHANWRASNKESIRAKGKKWRDGNPGYSSKWSANHRKLYPSVNREKAARHRACKFRATPAWANEFFISEAYALAQLRTAKTGIKWTVDHIVPLKSVLVCGLHVENNMSVITASENSSKGNRHWPDMPREVAYG